ncbi:MAG TPA: hypothetical protein VKZ46_03315 [Pedomonas sp.]|nr:hypothetical protein [Pedomonas sp.]
MTYTPEQVRAAIAHHGRECEAALRCAATAADAGMSQGMVDGFRKLAALHSDDAFSWARHLREGGAA